MADNNGEMLWRERKRWLFFGLPFTFTVYSFNKERIFISKGFFKTTEDEVRLYRIMDISLERSLGQKIFGLGTIKFCSSDKTLGDFEFKNIKNARETKEMLSGLIEKQRVEKRVVNREMMFDRDHDEINLDDDDSDN